MNLPQSESNEAKVAAAFSRQSLIFDQLYCSDPIVAFKRQRVRDHVMNFLQAGDRILELNSGSGEDAIFFASRGMRVHATDVSDSMLQLLQQKITAGNISTITSELCSFTRLDMIADKGPYDYIFSNMGGLNCSDQLPKVLRNAGSLLRSGGHMTLVIISGFCLWESLLFLRGKFRTATRRWFSARGTPAHVEGHTFRCWYYSPRFIRRQLTSEFDLLHIEGLCTLVPPSYMSGFTEKYPRLYRWLKAREQRWKSSWPWKVTGDYFIITLRKK